MIGGREFVFRYVGDASSLDAASTKAERAMGKTQGAAARLQNSLDGLASGGAAALIGGALTAGATVAGRALFEASSQAERLRITLGSVAQGDAGAELERLRAFSNRLGVDFRSTADAFVGFTAATRGTRLEGEEATRVFEAVTRSAKGLGASSENVTGVLLALQQMVSKGTVSAEELRGQLGERMPGAFQIAARAMGVTTAELGKMLEQGEILAEDFLPRFARQLEMELGGAADRAAGSMESSSIRMANAWEGLKQALGDTGIARAMADEMDSLASAISRVGAAMTRTRRAGGSGLAQVGAGVAQFGRDLWDFQFGDQNAAADNASETRRLLNRSAASALMGVPDEDTAGQRLAAARTRFMQRYRSEGDKLADELAEYRKQFAGRVTAAQQRADEAAIRAKHAKRGGRRERQPGRIDIIDLGSFEDIEAVDLANARERIQERQRREQEALRLVEQRDSTVTNLLGRTASGRTAEIQAQMQVLRDGLAAGRITDITAYTQAMAELDRELQEVGRQAERAGDRMSLFADEAVRNIQDAFGDTLYRAMRGSFDDIGDLWVELMQRMAAQAAAARLNEALFGNSLSGGTDQGLIGGIVRGLFGSTASATPAGNGLPSGLIPSGTPMATGTNYVPYDGFRAILHKGEAVVPKEYNPAAGGARVTINNYAGADIQTRERDDGGLDIDVVTRVVEQRIAGNVGQARGPMAGALKARGLNSSAVLPRMG